MKYRQDYVSGDRKKEGILPNLSIYENLVVPLYKKTSRAGFLGFIDWLELNGIFDWEDISTKWEIYGYEWGKLVT